MTRREVTPTEVEEYRRTHVPLLNDQKFKLVLFGTNLAGGVTVSTAEGVLDPTWETNARLVRLVDQSGMEAIIPVCRWIGFGGPSNWHGKSFETFTWAAGLAALSSYTMVVATSQVPAIHPIVSAKQGVTIDHISNGRFALNIVSGWLTTEMEFFGGPMLDHEGRYEQAAEWLELVKRLWTVEGEFDFEGKYYTVRKAAAEPKPIQKPYPVIINAGGSPRGRRFCAQHADVFFTSGDDLEHIAARVRDMRRLAWEEFQREIVILGVLVVVCRPTEKEAQDYRRYIVENGDWIAVENNWRIQSETGQTWSPEYRQKIRQSDKFVASYGSPDAVGSPEQVAEYLVQMSEIGLDGTSISFMGFWEEELERFTREVMPLLVQAGLRHEFRSPHMPSG